MELIECESLMSLASRAVSRRAFLKAIASAPLVGSARVGVRAPDSRVVLYNGVRLAAPWPPQRRAVATSPVPPPYLRDPPDVIPIDVGRQLFVDDFLIEETALERVFHRPAYHAASPVLRPTTAWEKRDEYAERTKTRSNPTAMVFSDGVFYDPSDRLFKMWYMGGYSQNVCYAFSADGIEWQKPSLDVVAGTNITFAGFRDSSTVWLDLLERDPEQRFKMACWYDHALDLYLSRDGIHWRRAGRSGRTGDRSTFFYNPFRDVWVYSLRNPDSGVRFRRYFETPAFTAGVQWREEQPVPWVGADALDPERPEYHITPELYNLDCVAYESVVLGLFTIFRGERNDREKPNDVCVGFSRDGFHWDRPDRHAFLPVSEQVGAWNWANVQSAGGCCLVVGDRLYFYVSGRRGVPGSNDPGTCTTGLAILRRDGFASMDAPPGPARPQRLPSTTPAGTLLTRPIRFGGRYLFVNVDATAGELRVEALDRAGRPLAGFTLADCEPIRGDVTRARVRWRDVDHLGQIAGRVVRFRFELVRASLYAFWVSGDAGGASGGYVAAGGPGLRGPIDAA
jgi:hypothetical protein